MASLNPWRRLRMAWRHHLRTQHDILEASRAAASLQKTTLEELRTMCSRLVTTHEFADNEDLEQRLGAPMPTIIYKQRKCARADCNWLHSYARSVTSQGGQDGILQKIFEVIEPTSRFAVEFGGYDGKQMSNIHRLITEDAWNGLFVEADPQLFAQIRSITRIIVLSRSISSSRGTATTPLTRL